MLFLVLVADFISVGIQCPVNSDFSFANTDSEIEYAITTEYATEQFHSNCTVGNISDKKWVTSMLVTDVRDKMCWRQL